MIIIYSGITFIICSVFRRSQAFPVGAVAASALMLSVYSCTASAGLYGACNGLVWRPVALLVCLLVLGVGGSRGRVARPGAVCRR